MAENDETPGLSLKDCQIRLASQERAGDFLFWVGQQPKGARETLVWVRKSAEERAQVQLIRGERPKSSP